MVFGIGGKKKKTVTKKTSPKGRPTMRSNDMDRYKDSARSNTRGGRSNGLLGRVSHRGSFKHDAMPSSSGHGRDAEAAGIRVTVRFRPLSRKERSKGDTAVWGVDENANIGRYQRGSFSPKYHFDTVFTEDKDNEYVYDRIGGEIVETAMSGVNGTIFAYGVTSSGKTHTMMGGEREIGLVPRAVRHVFDHIEQNPDKEYLLKLSMMEIYNEELNDLLNPVQRKLKVCEDKSKGVRVDGLTEVVLESWEQAICLIQTGVDNRQVSATQFNEGSSRSHTVCRVSVEVHDRNSKKGSRTLSFLNLIDLAGSESARAAKSKGHVAEGSFINKSLLTLGTVIHKLSEKKKSHIPFRDSKLTRLLQTSLTGNGSKMAIICCVTPSSAQAEETENTLKFAERAKKVKIKRSKNEMVDSKSEIAQLHHVIEDLKHQLKEMTIKAANPPQPMPDPALQEELAKVRERLEEELHARMKREQERLALEQKIKSLTRLILHSTRAQTGNTYPFSKMHRSHSFDALKAKSVVDSFSRRNLDTYVVHPNVSSKLPTEVIEMKSFSPDDETSLDLVEAIAPEPKERRTSFSSPMIRSPGMGSAAIQADHSIQEMQSENDFLKNQLNIVRQAMAEREKELAIRNRESLELKRRLTVYEQQTNTSTSRSHVSDEDTQTLEYSLLEADRSVLELSLIGARKEKERLTNELLRVKIELKRTKKRLQEVEGSQKATEQYFRAGSSAENIPMSPTGSASTTETGLSDSLVSPGRNSDERPPRHPQPQAQAPAVVYEQLVSSPTELRAKLSKLEAEVRCALQALSIKDNQIESQKREIVSQKEEAEEVKQLLHNLGSENESLKQRVKMLEAQQNRMQGYLLDTMPTTDLYALRAEIKDASHRLERAAYSRRISTIPALSFDELDTESTQDIYVSKGLESSEEC